ncbi:P-loop containing nucleoside triphosphate hydrolase protein [Rhexocercosporidium sp. MPI-PUGE-AT-0058]|nr:P-loop containing nucleoside triphosphate hydrolase protein [Rhexocercosporidium sp. MPI-PUGE-AT-0058]
MASPTSKSHTKHADMFKSSKSSGSSPTSPEDHLKTNGTNGQTNTEVNGNAPITLLEEDPFSSESSKILFDGMDELRRCGASVDLDLPQLVIVGQQSAGKSSLLRSLTDIPFPVGDGLCTRFATRIISRRSAPDTADEVKISIEPGDSELREKREPFNPHVPSITAEVFRSIFEQAGEHMGIVSREGPLKKRKNFSSDVLRIELHGPNRSHFGILDVPGIFHAVTDTVTKEDMKRVDDMVISHMKMPENVIICVAPATDNLANQQIFTMAKQHAESSRVVGVFTKCDRAPHPKSIVRIVRENKEIALHNGWFVVQNLPEDSTLDQETEEMTTFRQEPWIEIPAKQRGTAELKKFLANTLSSRIRKAFPDVQKKLKVLLAHEHQKLTALGEERPTADRRREYLLKILGRYQELARDSLMAPERLPSDAMKLRGMTQSAMQNFADRMEFSGHFHDFVNIDSINNDVEIETAPLYREIRNQIYVNRGEELAGMTNPAVMKPLFAKQTSKWESFGQEYLEEVVEMSRKVSLRILDYVAKEMRIPDHTKSELKNTILEFEVSSRQVATQGIQHYCHKNKTSMMVTTNKLFEQKVKQAQTDRFMKALTRYRTINPPESFLPALMDGDNPKLTAKFKEVCPAWVIVDMVSMAKLFEEVHPRATRNTEDEIHDLLKAYYEISLEAFKEHIISQIVEVFLQDSKGPVLGLSDKYVLSLDEEQIDILGGEDETVVADRSTSKADIRRLEEAMRIAEETWRKSMLVER